MLTVFNYLCVNVCLRVFRRWIDERASGMSVSWRDVCESIDAIVAGDVASGVLDPRDDDAVDVYAHEWADGCEWVIYYAQSRALWADPAMPDFDDVADDMCGAGAGVQDRVTAAVFLAVRDRILSSVARFAAVEE